MVLCMVQLTHATLTIRSNLSPNLSLQNPLDGVHTLLTENPYAGDYQWSLAKFWPDLSAYFL